MSINQPSLMIGGGFSDSEGNPLAQGVLTARLTLPCVDSATGTLCICPASVSYVLDDNGNVSIDPPQYIWPSDLITACYGALGLNSDNTTNSTFYMLEVEDDNGQLVYGPNAIFLNSSQGVPFSFSQFAFGDVGTEYLLSYPPVTNSVYVYVNGLQESDYTVSGSTVTLGFTPDFEDMVSFTYYTNPVSGISPVFEQETPSGSGTSFTLSHMPLSGTLALYRNGLFLTPGVDFTSTGTSISLNTNLGTDSLYAIYQISETFTTTVQETPSGAIPGNVFVLSQPCTPASLQFFVNGVYETQTNGGTEGYSLASDGVTITLPVALETGDTVRALYSEDLTIIDLSNLVPNNPW